MPTINKVLLSLAVLTLSCSIAGAAETSRVTRKVAANTVEISKLKEVRTAIVCENTFKEGGVFDAVEVSSVAGALTYSLNQPVVVTSAFESIGENKSALVKIKAPFQVSAPAIVKQGNDLVVCVTLSK